MKKGKILFLVFFILLFNILLYCFIKSYFYKNNITNIYIDNNDKIIIILKDNNKTYCSLDNNNWKLSKNNKCSLEYNENN